MNGYSNPETYHLALWLHNDEFLNNHWLPRILSRANGETYGAGQLLKESFEDLDVMKDLLGAELYQEIRFEVGSLWRVEWHEIFNGME